MARLLMKLTQEQAGRLYLRKCALEDELFELKKKSLEMEEAMHQFIERCEVGEIRSTMTYNKFCTILGREKDAKE